MLNFSTNQIEIRLADGSVIALPTDEEKKVIRKWRSEWGYMPDWKFIFRTTRNVKVNAKKRNETINSIFREIRNIGMTLKLFKGGSVGLGPRFAAQIPSYEVEAATGPEGILPLLKKDLYTLRKRELPFFGELYNEIDSLGFDKYSHFKIAIERYCMTYEEGLSDIPIDLMTGFESLYLGEAQELSYKVAMRAAYLLGNTEENRYCIYRALKKAYNLRNDLVHGKKDADKLPDKFHFEKNKAVGIVEFIYYISSLLRESIKRFMELETKYSHHCLTETILDDNILAGGRLLK